MCRQVDHGRMAQVGPAVFASPFCSLVLLEEYHPGPLKEPVGLSIIYKEEKGFVF